MECLKVEPEIEEFWTSYFYQVEKEGIVLELTVWPLESVIALSLRQSQRTEFFVDFALFVHGKVRYINDKRGQYLEFADCILAPRRFSHLEAERIWEKAVPNWTVELAIKPQIRIRYAD